MTQPEGPLRILIVEDNPIDALLLERMLAGETEQFEMCRAQQIAEATSLLSHPWDVILLDLRLPDCQGLETLRKVRALAPESPTVVITSLDDASLALEALNQGAQDYLIKGQITRDLLLRCVHYSIERQRILANLNQQRAKLHEINRTLEERVEERTRSLAHHQKQLRNLASKLNLAEQREHRRLASDLHDYLAQLLVSALLKMDELEGISSEDFRVVQEIKEILNQSITYTRTLVSELSPVVLYNFGLTAAVQWLADHMEQHYSLKVEVSAEEEKPPLTEDMSVLLFQSIRELLLNVVKHAKVREAAVIIRRESAHQLFIQISDRGVGFDSTASRKHFTESDHYGLFSVEERLESLGGKFKVESAPGRGTTIRLIVPLSEDPVEEAGGEKQQHGGDTAAGRSRPDGPGYPPFPD